MNSFVDYNIHKMYMCKMLSPFVQILRVGLMIQ